MAYSKFSLLKREIPNFLETQLALITMESIRVRKAGIFDPHRAKEVLREKTGQRVIAVDMGGDKFIANIFQVTQNGGLAEAGDDGRLALKSQNGRGYLSLLETVAKRAAEQRIPVGISTAGIVEATKLTASPNMSDFVTDLRGRYGGDLNHVFQHHPVVANDAIAGLKSGAIAAVIRFPSAQNVIYYINGGGLGQAILKEGVVYATEIGHFPVAPELNPYNQTTPCGMEGQNFVCIERVAASGAGVEDIWTQQTGKRLDGKEISCRYQKGESLAAELYNNSAFIIAHSIRGSGKIFNLLETPEVIAKTAIVTHGGCFRVPDYGARVKQILDKNLRSKVNMLILPGDYNACLEGAAIGALIA